jgi:hypothetical protein
LLERFENQENRLSRPLLASEIYAPDQLEAEARRLIENHQKIEHDNWKPEPEINARSGLFEELTAKGQLSVIEFDGPIEVINHRILQRLLNGYSENLVSWEEDRRFSEIIEELINHRVSRDIKAGILPPDTMVTTISNIPKGVPEKEASDFGYGVINDKGMTRTTGFENGFRRVEQISRSNSSDGSAERFLAGQGFVVGQGASRILRSQMLVTREHFPDGVVDIQRALDTFAGPNVIYGEDRLQANLNVPEYEDLREVSAAREQQAERQIQKLAEFERQLNIRYRSGEISYQDKLLAIKKRRKELVNEICILNPSYAKDARGEATVEHFEKASLAMAAGYDAAGIQDLEVALSVSDPRAGAVCGGTGLEKALQREDSLSAEATRLYLEAKSDRKYWKWTKGVCVVKECPTRPAKTDVGPCSVCRKCQTIFDNNNDPKNIYKTLGVLDLIFESFREFNQKYDAEQAAKKVAKIEKIQLAKIKEEYGLKRAA